LIFFKKSCAVTLSFDKIAVKTPPVKHQVGISSDQAFDVKRRFFSRQFWF